LCKHFAAIRLPIEPNGAHTVYLVRCHLSGSVRFVPMEAIRAQLRNAELPTDHVQHIYVEGDHDQAGVNVVLFVLKPSRSAAENTASGLLTRAVGEDSPIKGWQLDQCEAHEADSAIDAREAASDGSAVRVLARQHPDTDTTR